MNRQRLTSLGKALRRDQKGITGLETAIILIAFVVVASVFAFTVLSTGLFSAERGKETVHAGLEEARGSPVVKGSLIAYRSAIDDDGTGTVVTTNGITRVRMVLTNATSGEPVDLTPRIKKGDACADLDPTSTSYECYDGNRYTINTDNVAVVNYRDKSQSVDDLHWEGTWLGLCQETTCDDLLEVNETALITVWLHPQRDLDTSTSTDFQYVEDGEGGDTTNTHLATKLVKKTQFFLEVVPAKGSVLLVERTTPALLDAVMNLK